jgi:hypothetical protein
MMGRQARASVLVMRLWKPHDPGRSCLPFTIRHHATNGTDSQNTGALSHVLVGWSGHQADTLLSCCNVSEYSERRYFRHALVPGRDAWGTHAAMRGSAWQPDRQNYSMSVRECPVR